LLSLRIQGQRAGGRSMGEMTASDARAIRDKIHDFRERAIKAKLKAADGTPMNVEIYNTINKIQ
jgi:hypothetical protein